LNRMLLTTICGVGKNHLAVLTESGWQVKLRWNGTRQSIVLG